MMFLKHYVISTFCGFSVRDMLSGQFESFNKGKMRKRYPPAGPSIKELSLRKTGKISCEKMKINYFINFPTALFPGHKICQLRNNNHRLR